MKQGQTTHYLTLVISRIQTQAIVRIRLVTGLTVVK